MRNLKYQMLVGAVAVGAVAVQDAGAAVIAASVSGSSGRVITIDTDNAGGGATQLGGTSQGVSPELFDVGSGRVLGLFDGAGGDRFAWYDAANNIGATTIASGQASVDMVQVSDTHIVASQTFSSGRVVRVGPDIGPGVEVYADTGFGTSTNLLRTGGNNFTGLWGGSAIISGTGASTASGSLTTNAAGQDMFGAVHVGGNRVAISQSFSGGRVMVYDGDNAGGGLTLVADNQGVANQLVHAGGGLVVGNYDGLGGGRFTAFDANNPGGGVTPISGTGQDAGLMIHVGGGIVVASQAFSGGRLFMVDANDAGAATNFAPTGQGIAQAFATDGAGLFAGFYDVVGGRITVGDVSDTSSVDLVADNLGSIEGMIHVGDGIVVAGITRNGGELVSFDLNNPGAGLTSYATGLGTIASLVNVASIPEPASIVLVGAGLALISARRRNARPMAS